MSIEQTELSRELAIEENLFTYKGVLYERLYNHKCIETGKELKLRFFIDQDEYDYIDELP